MNISLLDPVVSVFVWLPLLLAAAFVASVAYAWWRSGVPAVAVRRAALLAGAGAAIWMAVTWMIADSGALREWHARPPRLGGLLATMLGLGIGLSASRVGARLATFVPLWALVGVQGFRLPLEIAMHDMANRGVMPDVMTWTGRNWDVLTGLTAIVVAVLLASGRAGHRLAMAWNAMGLLLLLNVVTVAVLATPIVGYFGEQELNVWVTYPPFVWLPAILVLAALVGHLVIFRALARQS